MQSKYEIITNNPLVLDKYKDNRTITYLDCSFEEVLKTARDRIHKGHMLLTHPLSGSIKPNETPYKSIMLSKEAAEVEQSGVSIIERAIESCEKFFFKTHAYTSKVHNDFQTIDLTLLESAMASADAW